MPPRPIAGQLYELRYSSPQIVGGYIVTAYGASANAVSSAQAPANGPWSATGSFLTDTGAKFAAQAAAVENAGAPANLTPTALIMDLRPKDAATASSGTLFRFIPSGPGTLKFDGIFWDIDEVEVTNVNMAATLTLSVQ